ncbi:hypothetical protein BDZ91DRAFT_768734 [Kalaharituber pfeilii]|nr:hypothetical protein BDZ91DRAFT_768734 [Kalaharituber pfeilii]
MHMVADGIAEARMLFIGMGDVMVELHPLNSTTGLPTLLLRGPTCASLLRSKSHPGSPATNSDSLPLSLSLPLPFPLDSPRTHKITRAFGDANGNFVGVIIGPVGDGGRACRCGKCGSGVKVLRAKNEREGMKMEWVDVDVDYDGGDGDGDGDKAAGIEMYTATEATRKRKRDTGAGAPTSLSSPDATTDIRKNGRATDISVAGNESVAVIVEWQRSLDKPSNPYPNPHLPANLEGTPSLTRVVADQLGWFVVAVDEEGGCGYVWGGRAGVEGRGLKAAIKTYDDCDEEEVEEVVLVTSPDSEFELKELGIGMGHAVMVAVTTQEGEEEVEGENEGEDEGGREHSFSSLGNKKSETKLYVCGRGSEGQLGLGMRDWVGKWTEVDLGPLKREEEYGEVVVERVWAGDGRRGYW